jgi:MarR-like DNA-binding transcriptional regulator SgrR of sgrS sRNA
MNERLVVWNDRTIEIIETIMLSQKITNLAKTAHLTIQITTLQVATATLTEEITIVDLVTEITTGEIVDVTVIEIATVTEDSAKSVKLLLDQMMYCYQLEAC